MSYKISQTELSYWFAKTSKPLLGNTAEPPSIHAVINAKAERAARRQRNLAKSRKR